ncbi:MAG: hypothetical protein AAGC93_04210 [Cyanobacteria bacterium P01_F01_bin.53]
MVNEQSLDITTYNKNALNNLRRAIVLGQGQFSLILARVNYRRLRRILLTELSEHLRLKTVSLQPTTTGLREAMVAGTSTLQLIDQVQALMVTGLEEVHQLEALLKSANLGRDELPKSFRYPVVLWVNDTVLQHLNRYAPDLKSFAATPIRFEYPVRSLITLLSAQANDTFAQILDTDQGIVLSTCLPFSSRITEPLANQELSFALAQLEAQERVVSNTLIADLLFLQGRNLHQQGVLPRTRSYYEDSLTHWQQTTEPGNSSNANTPDNLDKQAVLLFHLGLWWRSHALLKTGDYQQDCLKAQQYFEKTLAIFRQQKRRDRLSHFILALAEVLQKLENWPALSTVANAGTKLHKNDPARLARDYGYLAEVALAHYKTDPHPDYLREAEDFANQALTLSTESLSTELLSTESTAVGSEEIIAKESTELASTSSIVETNKTAAKEKNSPQAQEALESTANTHTESIRKESVEQEFTQKGSGKQEAAKEKAAKEEAAKEEAEKKVVLLHPSDTADQPIKPLSEPLSNSEIALRYHRSCYLYLLAIAQQLQGQSENAIAQLESARTQSNPYHDLSLHRRILDRLWHLYFDHQHYAQAFSIKLALRRIENLFGLRAFIGAGQLSTNRPLPNSALPPSLSDASSETAINRALAAELSASGRAADIDAITNRLAQPRYPLVVIHGQSGVGKSSTLSAGLVPKLNTLISEGRTTFPMLVTSYSNWSTKLHMALAQQHTEPWTNHPYTVGKRSGVENPQKSHSPSPRALINQLKTLTQNKYQQVVLIFDQFEDFFYEHPVIEQRRDLYAFLRDCLDLSYVKVVLAIREDFLHYLLEWDRNADLSTIDNDILSKEIRYYLGNFRPKAAELLIRQLTQAAGFPIEDGLITALVDDFAEDTGEVRPIELQVVGAQLQRENITTLSQYHALGRSPKSQLLKNFLDSVIRDCGPENSTIAQAVLYLLSEGTGRVIKSHSEIEEALAFAGIGGEVIANANTTLPQRLQLVLDILIGSGLIFEVPEVSGVRYRLVHEYLARLVQQQPTTSLIEALQTERNRRQLTEVQLQKALEAQSDSIAQTILARQKTKVAEIKALVSIARSLRLSGNGLEALTKAMRAAQQLSMLQQPATDNRNDNGEALPNNVLTLQTALCLDAITRDIREQNTLDDHRNWVLAVHCAPIASHQASHQAATIASASDDGTIKLWSDRGELLHTLTGHHAGVLDVKFSADGQYLASASLDHTIRLWTTTGDFIRAIDTVAASVTSVCFSPPSLKSLASDGSEKPLLAATYSDTIVRLWSFEGELVRTFEGHEDWARAVAFSPDGTKLVTGSEDQTVRLWSTQGSPDDPTKGTLLHSMTGHQGWVRTVDLSPDGNTIISAGDANTLRLWYTDGRKKKTLYGHEDWVRTVAFSPDGTRIASGGDDQTIKIWGSEGTIQQTFNQRSSVHSLAWSADGQSVVSGGDDDQVHIWRLAGPPEPIGKGHSGIVWSARWQKRPNKTSSKKIVSAGGDNTLHLWNEHGEQLATWEGHQRGVHSVDWSPDGAYFASASADHSIKIWTAAGELVRSLRGHEDAVWRVSYSPDGDRLASVSSDRTLRLWTAKGSKLLKTYSGHTDTIWHVSFSHDGHHLITASEDNTLRLWHPKKGLVQTITGHDGGIWCANFGPGGKFLASGGADGVIRLWSITWQGQHDIRIEPNPLMLRGHRDWVRSLSFSANGTVLASGSDDGTVRLWSLLPTSLKALQNTTAPEHSTDLQNARENTIDGDMASQLLPPLIGHEGVVWDVDFDHAGGDNEGERLVTASTDGTIRIWDLRLNALQKKGCQWLEDWLITRPELAQQICPSTKD